MALLRTKAEWSVWITDLGLTNDEAEEYAAALSSEAISETDLPYFDHELLKSCSVNKYGHRIKMIRKALGTNVKEEAKPSQNYSNKELINIWCT